MFGQFQDLHPLPLLVLPNEMQPATLQLRHVLRVHLVPVSVPFSDNFFVSVQTLYKKNMNTILEKVMFLVLRR